MQVRLISDFLSWGRVCALLCFCVAVLVSTVSASVELKGGWIDSRVCQYSEHSYFHLSCNFDGSAVQKVSCGTVKPHYRCLVLEMRCTIPKK